ncbi:MAG: hydrogenase nickel incorporation protein HypB [Nocardioidaceae bacterium]
MCATCGCGEGAEVLITDPAHPHEHTHSHDHGHDHGREHGHGHGHGEPGHAHTHTTVRSEHLAEGAATGTVSIETAVLAKNDRLAAANRAWLAERGITVVDLMSSPGSGKTTLLERTIAGKETGRAMSVIEGDQQSLLDAQRVQAAGVATVQVTTGTGCHLDAAMIASSLERLEPPASSLVIVENVGNLVCPALFDLGEMARVVIMSVTEGADKPLKYPPMFRAADLLLLNKVDLLPHLPVPVEECVANAHRVNPALRVLPISATRGDGLRDWYGWLRQLSPADRCRS